MTGLEPELFNFCKKMAGSKVLMAKHFFIWEILGGYTIFCMNLKLITVPNVQPIIYLGH